MSGNITLIQKLGLAILCCVIFGPASFAALDWCALLLNSKLLGPNPSRRDLEVLSDYSVSSGDTRYFFSKGDVLGYCKAGRCTLALPGSSAAHFAAHAEILKRQNPTLSIATDSRQMMQISIANIESSLGILQSGPEKIDASAPLAEVLQLAMRNFLRYKPTFSREEDFFILDSISSLKAFMKDSAQPTALFKYLYIFGSHEEVIGLYFGPFMITHHQMAVLLFGQELAENPSFIKKFVRGGVIAVGRKMDGHWSYFIDSKEAYLVNGRGRMRNISLSSQEIKPIHRELDRSLNRVM